MNNMNNMNNMNIMEKKCSICNNNNNNNTNLYFMSYNKSPFRLYFHLGCKNKLKYFLGLIFKNQEIKINMKQLEYGDIISKSKSNNSTKSCNGIDGINQYVQLSDLITTKFLCFTKIYNIMELINQIQLNDPLYNILLIVSTWFDY